MPDTGTNENTLTGRNVGKTCRTHYRGTLMTERSLILLMTVESHWNLSVEQVR